MTRSRLDFSMSRIGDETIEAVTGGHEFAV